MKKYRKGIIATLGIVLGIIALNVIISTTTDVNVLSNTINFITNKKSPNEIKSISLTSDGYNDNTGGSYDIKKSAEWTGTDTAQINFDVDTRMKTGDNHKDVVLVLDISGSMSGEKLNKVKSDAKEITEFLLSDQENRVALITFESTSKIEYELTDNKEDLLAKIDSLTDTGCTNYNQALINVDKVLEGYEKKSNRDLAVLFLTDGYPNEEIPNQVSQYKMLKEKYPYITINGIQYEMGKDIIEDIKNISDNQYIASMDTLNNILFGATIASDFYEKFELVDYIDNEYFYVENVNDIKVSIGKVELTEENGVQKVIWRAEPNEFRTGNSANMTINLKLKEQYVGNEGYYPTNKKFEVTTKLLDEKEATKETDKTPILKSGYKVIYDTNTPIGCDIDNFEETHYAFENVRISDKELTCEGYQFKGWKIIDDVKILNDDYFIMPGNDVTIKAVWSKQSIIKSMDGTVYIAPLSIMKKYAKDSTDDYHNYKYRRKVTKIVIKDNIDVPTTAIESWDVSQEGNNSVIAYIEDDGTGNGTYKVTIGGYNKVIANEDSSYLFYGFYNLKEIQLKNIDTSKVTDMSYMFYGCSSLTSLDVSNFDTSNVTDMSGMFHLCRGLTSLDLSNFDTSQVTNMGSMFSGCSKLTSLNVSDFDTSNVTDMRDMFFDCRSLTSLDVSSFDTSKVTNMQDMFYECNSLTSLDVSSFDTSNVTNMQNMFYKCNSLTSLDLSNFDTSNVTDMSKMFMYSSLTNLDLSNFDTSQVTNMYFMFGWCQNLTSIDVSSFDTSNVTNMQNMFSNCSNLTSLDLSNFDTSNVTSMWYMFYECNSLTSLDVSSFDTSNVTNMQDMFMGCKNLKSLDVSNFDTSNVTNMQDMFYKCNSLTSLDVSNFDTRNVTRMSSMFKYCSGLTSLDVSNFDTSNVTDMSSMFMYCWGLTSLDLSNFDTSKVTDMPSMFEGSWGLTSLDLSNFDTSRVTRIFRMFYDCSSLTTTINIKGKPSAYSEMFYRAARNSGAKITVNYTSDNSSLVNALIATKSTDSNVVKGSLITN